MLVCHVISCMFMIVAEWFYQDAASDRRETRRRIDHCSSVHQQDEIRSKECRPSLLSAWSSTGGRHTEVGRHGKESVRQPTACRTGFYDNIMDVLCVYDNMDARICKGYTWYKWELSLLLIKQVYLSDSLCHVVLSVSLHFSPTHLFHGSSLSCFSEPFLPFFHIRCCILALACVQLNIPVYLYATCTWILVLYIVLELY